MQPFILATLFENEDFVVHSVSDDMSVDLTSDWSKADCTAAFDTDHYEITRTAGTQSFYQSGLTFVNGTTYTVSFYIKDGTASGETITLMVGDTFYGGEALSEPVVSTGSYVKHEFNFTAGVGTTAFSFQSDFAAGNYELKNFLITS